MEGKGLRWLEAREVDHNQSQVKKEKILVKNIFELSQFGCLTQGLVHIGK